MTKITESPKEIIHLPEGTKELVIRHGEAEPIRDPSIAIEITGRLDSPRRYIAGKQGVYEPVKAHVIIDTNAATVTINLNEKDHFGDTITGGLKSSPLLDSWAINTGKRFDVYTLLSFVKRNKFFFPDPSEWAALVTYLSNFKGKVTTDFVRTQDNRGNSNNSTVRAVAADDSPKEFKLSVPLFAGYEAKTFMVEVCIDPQTVEIKLYLESAEVFGLIEAEKIRLLQEEEEYFSKYGASVIYK